MATFGQKLKAIRLHRDMSQEDIAHILDTTKQSISRYEIGVNSPRLDTIADMAEKLNIELSLLINDDYSVDDVLSYKPNTRNDHYYYNDEARQIANEIAQDKELKMLFSAARDVSAEDLKTVHALMKSLKRKERGDDD